MRVLVLIGLVGVILNWPTVAQGPWQIPHRERTIQVDGFLDDWNGVPELVLSPSNNLVETVGTFGQDDLKMRLQGLWDQESLYLALHWKDDVWDLQRVQRRDAVFVTPSRRRRNRMFFFDYLKIQLHTFSLDYILWVSPRVNDQGPFYWQRRLAGKRNMEAAAPIPVITPREHEDGSVTMEILLNWKGLGLKPKQLRKRGLPLSFLLADSDWPDSLLESKLERLKRLEWDRPVVLRRR